MKKYRSDVNNSTVLKLLATLSLIIYVGAVIGQLTFDIFPLYSEVLIAALLPLGLYIILWAFAVLMPITVKDDGIKCYDAQSKYKDVLWSEIESVHLMKLCGLPYACVETSGLSSPLTVPLYLGNMEDFKDTVICCAGINNPLSEFLRSET